MDKVYNPKSIEEKFSRQWVEDKRFHSVPDNDKGRNWVIVIPPPNVTGALHMGHALNNTLQDIIIRWHKMMGHNALWVPGTDHGGIATQNVYERVLKEKGKTRYNLGRQKFVEEMKEWSSTTSGTIIGQLKRLGCACDWDRLRFTMDDTCAKAVNASFVELFKKKLIYRGRRIVNWCPRCHTALADIEVEHKESKGKLWYIRYPFVDNPTDGIIVATTRPETMLGDTAVAVNPNDERYKDKIGKYVELPLVKRRIPVVADSVVESSFGTGAVKVTPSHDAVDFEIAERHKLKHIRIMTLKLTSQPDTAAAAANSGGVEMSMEADRVYAYDSNGTEQPPEYRKPIRYTGLAPVKCREIVVQDLIALGVLVKEEDYKLSAGECYRCSNVVEPLELEQWFLNTQEMASRAVKATEDGEVKFYPDSWEKPYLTWLDNLKDWCISRQIWWGHRIPVWYCTKCKGGYINVHFKTDEKGQTGITTAKNKNVTGGTIKYLLDNGVPFENIEKNAENIFLSHGVLEMKEGVYAGENHPEKCDVCECENFVQDPDVLDTWFSSALWPFSVFGWPQTGEEMKYYYPTSVLVTAYEILYLWVARMVMMGLTFQKTVPFKHVYVHGIVRDIHGKKMSKSLGNVINPLSMMEEYSTDALRFSLAMASTPGRDLQLSEDSFIGARNFVNKLWNATRFVMMNIEDYDSDDCVYFSQKTLANNMDRWITGKFKLAMDGIMQHMLSYNIAEVAKIAYDFVWHDFCDWYLELVKPRIGKDVTSPADKVVAQKTLIRILIGITQVLHPVMPFISEEIYRIVKAKVDKNNKWPVNLLQTRWPVFTDADTESIDAYKRLSRVDYDIVNSSVIEDTLIAHAIKEMRVLQDVVTAVRTVRSELNVPPGKKVEVHICVHETFKEIVINRENGNIAFLTRADKVVIGDNIVKPEKSAAAVVEGIEVFIPLADLIDFEKEKVRLTKVVKELEAELQKIDGKLSNQNFITRAVPAEVVRVRKLREDTAQRYERIKKNLEVL
ncbi:MAG: valine--tRNA ligase [Elusimicrobiota bacterium]